jgi:hypothetical protein
MGSSKMNKLGYIAGACLIAPNWLLGQSLVNEINFRSGTLGGIRLNGISVYSGYSSSVYPGFSASSPLATSAAGQQSVGPDVNYGASLSLEWQYHRPRTNFLLLYSGAYGGFVENSGLNGLSQGLTFGFGRQLTSKWLFNMSGSIQDATQVEYLNRPSSLSVLSQLPLSFDDLSAAFSISQFTNAQVATALSSAPQFESPARNLLVGNRIITYSGQTGLTYSHSSRFSLQFSGFTAAGQFRTDTSQAGASAPFSPLPRSIGMNAAVGLSYSLSPRTTLGLNASETYIENRYQAAYVTSATVSLGRKMGQHWFLNGYGGMAVTHMARQLYDAPATSQWTGGASIGFRTYQHTFVGSYARTGADTYGFAAGKNSLASASWVWRRPGSRWSIFSSGGQQEMTGNGFANLKGWTISGGCSNHLNTQTVLTAQYSYSTDSALMVGAPASDIAIHILRVSLSWSPAPVVR